MKKIVLGIAGNIGSGKTTVANFFKDLGAYYIDADKVVDELYQPGQDGQKKIQCFFGDEYILKSGHLNRKKLGKIVFDDPKKLKILNTLIHPLVTAHVQKLIDKADNNFIVLEATYFEKKHLHQFISALVWVDCDKKTAYQNLQNLRPLDKDLFEKIWNIQIKPEHIDFSIKNNGDLNDLKKQVKSFYEKNIRPRL